MAKFKCKGECVKNGKPYCEMIEEVEEVKYDPSTGEEKTVKSFQCMLEYEEEY